MKRHFPVLLLLALAACASHPPSADRSPDSNGVFRVNPVRPVAELTPIALASTPPSESGTFRPADLVELTVLDPAIKLDIRYATTRNFLGTPIYSQPRAFLQRPAAEFVADPAEGSRHNRGCAVDLTLYDLRTGRAVSMPSLYDEATERAYANYAGGTAEQRRLRDLLRRHMEAEGFSVYEFEWWHFDYRDWKAYAIENVRFEEIR